MFDSTPPNLPVEPQVPKPAAQPPQPASIKPQVVPVPSAPPLRPTLSKPLIQTDKKDPEDIFSGLDVVAEQREANMQDTKAKPAPRRSPIIIISIIVAAIVVVGFVAFVVWAFVLKPKTPSQKVSTPKTNATAAAASSTPAIQPTSASQPALAPVTQTPAGANIPLPVGTNGTTSSAVSSSETTSPAVIPIPSSAVVSTAAPTEGIDLDKDGLTNIEEALYGTVPDLADTDGDGFPDGSEVRNLYNPAGKNQLLTKNSNVISVKWNGWSMLIPKSWTLTADKNDPATASIQTGSQTQIRLQARVNVAHQTLTNWIGSSSSGMRSYTTKSGFHAMESSDGLTTYVSASDTILIVTYDLNGDPSYEYRTTYAMIINALQIVAP